MYYKEYEKTAIFTKQKKNKNGANPDFESKCGVFAFPGTKVEYDESLAPAQLSYVMDVFGKAYYSNHSDHNRILLFY